MDFSTCKLFNVQTKKQLARLLSIHDKRFFKQSYCLENIKPYIRIGENQKKRLIEVSSPDLKRIQSTIKKYLQAIPVKPFVFSGVKGLSYPGNAQYHKSSSDYLFKTDLTGFFPSISRDSIFSFFHNEMKMSSDTAAIVSNFLTIDLGRIKDGNIEEIYEFLEMKGITCTNHLLTGSPASTILSYVVNHKLFDELFEIANRIDINMSIYIDDLTFSSKRKISYSFRRKILYLLIQNGFLPAKKKTKYYNSNFPKLVTGVILDKCEMKVPNRLRKRVIASYIAYKANKGDLKALQSAKGVLNSARQIEPTIFPSLIFRR